ncbi:MAG: hypothetical protein ACI8Y8_001935 [Planctomycetota bacterium]|jgi:hypothetical protein
MLHAALPIPLLLVSLQNSRTSSDWLVTRCDTPTRVIASVDRRELCLDNGLIRRTPRIETRLGELKDAAQVAGTIDNDEGLSRVERVAARRVLLELVQRGSSR